jgi:hypothetical protein
MNFNDKLFPTQYTYISKDSPAPAGNNVAENYHENIFPQALSCRKYKNISRMNLNLQPLFKLISARDFLNCCISIKGCTKIVHCTFVSLVRHIDGLRLLLRNSSNSKGERCTESKYMNEACCGVSPNTINKSCCDDSKYCKRSMFH